MVQPRHRRGAITDPLVLSTHSSPLGKIITITQGDALVALDFEDFEDRLHATLKQKFPGTAIKKSGTQRTLKVALKDYFAGDIRALKSLPVKMRGTDFQNQVWRALRKIPAGKTVSYGALAERVGRPGAARAVGLANGSNPIALVVPCHRVIGSNGALTGYGCGIERKRWLLEHEGAI